MGIKKEGGHLNYNIELKDSALEFINSKNLEDIAIFLEVSSCG